MRSAEPANAAGLEKSPVRSFPGQVDFLVGEEIAHMEARSDPGQENVRAACP